MIVLDTSALTKLIDKDRFKQELRGCIERSKIDPLEAKKIWRA